MTITEITVTSGRKWPHPEEQYSNLTCSISMTAVLSEDDDKATATKHLQDVADALADEHKARATRALETAAKYVVTEGSNTKAVKATADKAARLASKHQSF